MKVLRCLAVLFSLSIILIMLGCGADTSGALTMTAPTSTNNGDGTFSVSTTVTYAPPSGMSAQGVKISTTGTDSFGVVTTDEGTLTSGSNAIIYTFTVAQHVGISNHFSIVSSIGGMTASTVAIIPAITPLSALGIDFLAGDALLGATKTTTVSGGVGAYSLVTVSPINGVLTFSIAGNILTVKYISVTTSALQTAQVVIQDGLGNLLSIPVTYYK